MERLEKFVEVSSNILMNVAVVLFVALLAFNFIRSIINFIF